MNKGIIFVIGAVVGGAISSELTFIWTKKKLETKYDALRREDYESIRNEFEEKYTAFEGYTGEKSEGAENEAKLTSRNASVTHQEAHRAILGSRDDEEVMEDEKTSQNTNKRSKEHTDYSKISKNNAGLKAPMANNVEKKEWAGAEVTELKPYVITPKEFDLSDNEHVAMQYYLDGTLTDDMGEPIQPSDYFGDIDIESSFDDYSDEPDLLFIRDPKLKIDYEISKVLVQYPETTGERTED